VETDGRKDSAESCEEDLLDVKNTRKMIWCVKREWPRLVGIGLCIHCTCYSGSSIARRCDRSRQSERLAWIPDALLLLLWRASGQFLTRSELGEHHQYQSSPLHSAKGGWHLWRTIALVGKWTPL